MRHERIQLRRSIDSAGAALRLVAPALAGLDHEELRLLHLDGALRLLGVTAASGDGEVEVPLRALVADALALGTRGLVMAHNHPGGDPAPSRADIRATRRVVDALRPVGVRLVDHLVLAGPRFASFRALGWL